MTLQLSGEQASRLQQLAEARGCSVETLVDCLLDEMDPLPGGVPSRRVLDMAADLIAIASFEGHLLHVNPAFCKALGYDFATLTSQPFKGQSLQK